MYAPAALAITSCSFKHNMSQTIYMSVCLLNINLTQNFQFKFLGSNPCRANGLLCTCSTAERSHPAQVVWQTQWQVLWQNNYSILLRQQTNYITQWRTKELFSGGGSTNTVESRGQRWRGSGGCSPLVRGSGGSCNLVQEISFHIVKFS